MKGIVNYCPEVKCNSNLIAHEPEFDMWRCYKCRKIFFKPRVSKKVFNTLSLFGEE